MPSFTSPIDSDAKLDGLARHMDPAAVARLHRERARLEKLRDGREAANDRLQRLHEQIGHVKFRIARLEAEKEQYGSKWTDEAEERLQFERDELARLETVIAEARADMQAPDADSVYVAFLRDQCDDLFDIDDYFGALNQRARFEPVETAIPNGQQAQAKALAACRKNSGDVITAYRTTRRTHLPLDTILSQAFRDVDKLASAGEFNYDEVGRMRQTRFGGDTRQGHLRPPIAHEDSFNSTRATSGQLGVSMLCAVLNDHVKAHVREKIVAKYGKAPGMSAEDRAAKLAELVAEFMRLQHTEARLVEALEGAGAQVERRPMHPLAVLGLRRIGNAPRPVVEREEPLADDFESIGSPIEAEHVGRTQLSYRDDAGDVVVHVRATVEGGDDA